MDGLALCRQVRMLLRENYTYIVLLTASPRTTKLYDRRTDDISLDEVEKIAI